MHNFTQIAYCNTSITSGLLWSDFVAHHGIIVSVLTLISVTVKGGGAENDELTWLIHISLSDILDISLN